MGFHSNDVRGAAPPLAQVPLLVQSKGAEVGVRTQAIRGLDSTLAVFVLDFDSELTFSGDSGDTQPNRPSRRIGVEFANRYRPTTWAMLDGDFAYTYVRFKDTAIRSAVSFPRRRPSSPRPASRWARMSAGSARCAGAIFGARPLIEDGSVYSGSTSLFDARVGYTFENGLKLNLDVLNLLNTQADQITYYYTSRAAGEPMEGVNDVHFHPVEPLAVRFTVSKAFSEDSRRMQHRLDDGVTEQPASRHGWCRDRAGSPATGPARRRACAPRIVVTFRWVISAATPAAARNEMHHRQQRRHRPAFAFQARSARGYPDPGTPRRTARNARAPASSFRGRSAVPLRSSRPFCPLCRPPMSFLDHIDACNNADLSQFEPWYVGAVRAGFLHRDFLPMVAVRPDLFSHRDGGWYLEPSLDTPAKRTAAMRAFLLELRERGLFGRAVARGAVQGRHALQRSDPARDGARRGAVVRRARLRAAHDGLRGEERRAAPLGAAALVRASRPFPASSTTPSPAGSRRTSASSTT